MPYDLFISYSRCDNENGRVTQLVERISSDFQSFAGRPLRVFFDKNDIQGMDDWRQKIQQSLRESHLFLAALSPDYLASPYCRWEWEDYVRYEAMRQCLGEGVAPVFFVTLPDATDPETDQAIAGWIKEIQDRQTFDLIVRPWHDAGEHALQQAHVKSTLEQLQTSVRERLDRAERARRSPDNLIRHNPAFVGRVRELTELRAALTKNKLGVVGAREGQAPGRATVQGLGGMGKTELALAYAHAFAWDYPGGRWQIGCEHIGDLRVALLQLAGPLKFEFTDDENKSLALAFERVLRELTQRERCLLLLDNLSDPSILEPEYLDRLPHDGRVDLIATTRLAPRNIPGSAQAQTFIAVDELPEEDALALMRSHQPQGRFSNQEEDDYAREIVRLLEGFTLAVETAGIYLGRYAGEVTCAQFLRDLRALLLEQSETAAGDSTVAVRHRERLLEKTLAFTLETLSLETLHVLNLAALLPADSIALPWLQSVGSEQFAAFNDGPEVPNSAFQQTTELLLGLRLFQTAGVTDADGRLLVARMHRLVQELITHTMSEDSSKLNRELIHFCIERASLATHAWADVQHRWEVEPLRATAMKWLAKDQPAGVKLASAMSGPLYHLGRWTESEQLARLGIALQTRISGADSLDITPLANNLAIVLRRTNRLREAEEMYRRALKITEANLGREHPNLAVFLSNLADVLRDTNRLAEAEPLIRRALFIAETHLGPMHSDVAASLNNLATLFQLTGRFTQAEPLVRRALKIHESNLGPNHPDVGTDLNNLATVLFSSDRLDEAEPFFRRALVIEEQTLSDEHPSIALSLVNLAELLLRTNRIAEAESYVRRAIAINERHYGPDHPEVARALNAHAGCLAADNRLRDAETAYRRSLAIAELNFGSFHPHVSSVLTGLASVLYRQQKLDESIMFLRRNLVVLAKFSRTVGQDHPDLDRAIKAYAGVMEAAGRRKVEITEQIRLALSEAS